MVIALCASGERSEPERTNLEPCSLDDRRRLPSRSVYVQSITYAAPSRPVAARFPAQYSGSPCRSLAAARSRRAFPLRRFGSCLAARRDYIAIYYMDIQGMPSFRAQPPLPQCSLLAPVAVPGHTGPSCAFPGDVRPEPLRGRRDGPCARCAGTMRRSRGCVPVWGVRLRRVILVSGRPPGGTGWWLALRCWWYSTRRPAS